jgi:alkanesulfonate monooxygenase SsuD/methylene tetrahydromethanopterin reductase-like flavin-dependent oxidoreductase (luciferase family)
VFAEPLAQGFAKATGGKGLERFAIAPLVHLSIDSDLEKSRLPVKQMLALYIGGMGARDKNFYNDYAKRLGYEADARKIQDLYLDGKQRDAVAAVPDKLVDEIALTGSKDRVRDRLSVWVAAAREKQITDMLLLSRNIDSLRFVSEAIG